MRFYDPSDPDPKPIASNELFPKAELEDACKRCLKMGLVPSVTSVLGVIRQEYIERWKMGEAVRNYQTHGNAWMAVDTIFNSDSKESRFGTDVHDCIHRYLTKQPILEPQGQPWCHALPAVDWLRTNVKELLISEGTFACRKTGTAGTIDIAFINQNGEHVLADIKVVKVRRSYPLKPPLAYRTQLSAYEMMLREQKKMPPMKRLSLYLASPFGDCREPKVIIFPYERNYEDEFRSALHIWHAQYGVETEDPHPLLKS